MPITPQSTGGPAVSSSASGNGVPSSPTGEGSSMPKKSRRQATVFAHAGSPKPVKPFSRSAAKRESVLALGSIEHLQQYYTRTGMVNKKNPLFDKKHYGMVPAIGGMPLSPTEGSHAEDQAPSIEAALAPQPEPTRSTPPVIVAPHVKSHEAHPDSLLPGVITELSELVKLWEIDEPQPTSHPIDVLPLLRTTTRTIQTVRNYVLSLPSDSVASIKIQFSRTPSSSQAPFTSTPSTPPLNDADPSSSSSTAGPPPDPLALIRRCSLEVLGFLRELEETARLPLSDEAYDAHSDGGGSQRGRPGSRGGPSPSPRTSPPLDLPPSSEDPSRSQQYYGDLGITFSLVQVHGKFQQVPVWEDEDAEDLFDDESTKEKREMWHERLEVGNGWLYRRDIHLSELARERTVISSYLDAVDNALFPRSTSELLVEGATGNNSNSNKKERGWEIERKKMEIRTSRFASLTLNGPRSRSKVRRVSSGEALNRGNNAGFQASALLLDSSGGKRRISTGMLGLMGAQTKMVAEPEEMEGIREEGIDEEDEEDGEELDHELEDDELPDWARRSAFEDDELGRAYAFISAYLPSTYHHALVPPSPGVQQQQPSSTSPDTSVEPSRAAFLSSLSSGQLLCLAYNVCVRKSRHPWGFVSKEGIHDIIALEKAAAAEGRPAASNKTGWTFRRTDNLRLWIGALKLRYMLPIQMPSQIIHALPPSLLKLPSVVSNLGGPRAPRGSAPSSPRKLGGFGPAAALAPPAASGSIAQSKSSGAATPSSSASSPSAMSTTQDSSSSNSSINLMFDAKVVARKEEGWEDMLERALVRWMWKAVGEKRKAVPTPIG
ncbi:hypothetical protein EST38_g5352 [Candolleomyces aberdarensis]|uniref:Uncharacterized protein n=1 Tax=Candolleomyces aberdarensis TaxID=2316362 RepID=A0A4Q2DKA0_9AGAR|nr:hypothetical protein EST38_g5352 [Candolleomyces aberdarensis]